MSTAVIEHAGNQSALLERILIQGDLKSLNPAERLQYYRAVCESVGLNPLTQPFAYITLNNKLVLYAQKAATDQLRKINHISIDRLERELIEGVYTVAAHAKTTDGRTDESLGAVAIEGLKGEARANAMMKAETKSKRRVTLSICGLGMLDESEVESIPGAKLEPPPVIAAAAQVSQAKPPNALHPPKPNGMKSGDTPPPQKNQPRAEHINKHELVELLRLMTEAEADSEAFMRHYGVNDLAKFPAEKFSEAVVKLQQKINKLHPAEPMSAQA